MIPKSCDVLIVGAGPVGMAAAITLAQAGIAPVLIDRAEVQQTTSRAAVIHAHTLEVLAGRHPPHAGRGQADRQVRLP
jgi:2-polyprenyl-6-methoxyphenol hydroxylase-like FAD-dependent oxidoreductase